MNEAASENAHWRADKMGHINNAQVMGSVAKSATPIQTVIFINNKLGK